VVLDRFQPSPVPACQAFAADKIIALPHKTRFSQVAFAVFAVFAVFAAFATLVDQQRFQQTQGAFPAPITHNLHMRAIL